MAWWRSLPSLCSRAAAAPLAEGTLETCPGRRSLLGLLTAVGQPLYGSQQPAGLVQQLRGACSRPPNPPAPLEEVPQRQRRQRWQQGQPVGQEHGSSRPAQQPLKERQPGQGQPGRATVLFSPRPERWQGGGPGRGRADGPSVPRDQQRLTARDVAAQRSCAAVWQLLSQQPGSTLRVPVLSQALDRMVKLAKERAAGELAAADAAAVVALFRGVQERLDPGVSPRLQLDAWALVSFIRFAAAFKAQLQPQAVDLAPWQVALQRPDVFEELTTQGIGNSLLSLGTLADSQPALLAATDKQLARRLLQRAVELAEQNELSPRHAVEVLYGATLLQLQPSQGQVKALFHTIGQAADNLASEDVTQLLLGCAKLTVAQSTPGEAPLPSRDPFRIYYPGNDLMARALDRACQLARRKELGVQGATQILGACGALGYLPSQVALDQLLAVLLAMGDGLLSIDASTALLGCAKLGWHPGQQVIQACWEAVVRGGQGNPQGLSNATWALAMLEACDLGMWDQLAALMTSCMDNTADVALQQFHQAYLLLKARYPGEGTVACPPQLLQRSLAAHLAVKSASLGRFERMVAKAVRGLAGGCSVETGYAVQAPGGKGCVWVDVALPGLRIAIEADRPRHFLRNGQLGRQGGATLARNRLLRAWGWEVVVVPHTVFDAMCAYRVSPPADELVAGLQRHLEQEVGLVQLMASKAAAALPAA